MVQYIRSRSTAAIQKLTRNKATGDDNIPAEFIQALGPNGILSRQPSSRQAARGLGFQEISTVAATARAWAA